MKLKKTVERILIHCPPLFKLGSKIYHRVNNSFMTLSPGTPEAILRAFKLASKDTKHVGDYYEFGMFRGFSFLKAYQHAESLGLNNVHFYGFDSFEGLPAAEGIDKADGRFFEGQFACSKEDVQTNLASNGMDMNRVELIKGFYEDSLTDELKAKTAFKPASVILLDCDLYSSTIEALTWVNDYLQDGTILLFDDWFSFGESKELGQQKAAQEFLDANPGYSLTHLWPFCKHGDAYVLHIEK